MSEPAGVPFDTIGRPAFSPDRRRQAGLGEPFFGNRCIGRKTPEHKLSDFSENLWFPEIIL